MPPRCVKRVVRTPALDACAVRLACAIFELICRTELELRVQSGEAVHICEPAVGCVRLMFMQIYKNRRDSRISIEHIEGLYIIFKRYSSTWYRRPTLESTSYMRKPELKFVIGVTDGAIYSVYQLSCAKFDAIYRTQDTTCAVSRFITVPLFV